MSGILSPRTPHLQFPLVSLASKKLWRHCCNSIAETAVAKDTFLKTSPSAKGLKEDQKIRLKLILSTIWLCWPGHDVGKKIVPLAIRSEVWKILSRHTFEFENHEAAFNQVLR